MNKLLNPGTITIAMASSLILSVIILAGDNAAYAFQKQKKSEQEQETLKLNTTLVEVPTIVTGRDGNFISDLSQNDFAVFEDGKRQEIGVFAAVKQPFNAVLVLDTSNSAHDRLRVIQSTAVSFSREVGPDDRMMVVSFDNEVRELIGFTSDREELKAAIEGTESGFGKLLYEAVARALSKLKDVEGRRAVVLFSDAIDLGSVGETAESTIRMAEEIGAVIYIVRFNTRWWIEAEARRQKAENPESKVPFSVDGRIPLPPDFGGPDPTPTGIPAPRAPRIEITTGSSLPRRPPSDPITENLDRLYGEADDYIEKLSSRTGGLIFRAENFDSTRSAFRSIAEELRNMYLLGYYPSKDLSDAKYRKIKVEVKGKNLKVRARQGYRPEGGEQ
ncbi:MAG: VWA domain-containing protein [Blastocatellia bacterium]|nr:VWA domain-containing protein [Blastocatellia bacterium]